GVPPCDVVAAECLPGFGWSVMPTFARTTFTSFGLSVPTNCRDPVGDPDEQQYRDAFKPEEKSTMPVVGPAALFRAASGNKYHTDAQKMHCVKVGKFIDDTCKAIC